MLAKPVNIIRLMLFGIDKLMNLKFIPVLNKR